MQLSVQTMLQHSIFAIQYVKLFDVGSCNQFRGRFTQNFVNGLSGVALFTVPIGHSRKYEIKFSGEEDDTSMREKRNENRPTLIHSVTIHSTRIHSTPIHSTQILLQFASLRFTPLQFTALKFTLIHFTPIHSTVIPKYPVICNS